MDAFGVCYTRRTTAPPSPCQKDRSMRRSAARQRPPECPGSIVPPSMSSPSVQLHTRERKIDSCDQCPHSTGSHSSACDWAAGPVGADSTFEHLCVRSDMKTGGVQRSGICHRVAKRAPVSAARCHQAPVSAQKRPKHTEKRPKAPEAPKYIQ